jgi:hypothetical protein
MGDLSHTSTDPAADAVAAHRARLSTQRPQWPTCSRSIIWRASERTGRWNDAFAYCVNGS